MTTPGRSRKNSGGARPPPRWGGPWLPWASSPSMPSVPRPRAASSGCGRPSRIGGWPSCGWRALPPSRPPTPSSPSSRRPSMPASPGPPPTRSRRGGRSPEGWNSPGSVPVHRGDRAQRQYRAHPGHPDPDPAGPRRPGLREGAGRGPAAAQWDVAGLLSESAPRHPGGGGWPPAAESPAPALQHWAIPQG